MLVGVPKEIKDNEYRVGLVPSTVRELTREGHRVMVETGAGLGAGLADADYQAAGAEIAPRRRRRLRPRRTDREGQGAARAASARSCGAGRSCSPICISRPTARRPRN